MKTVLLLLQIAVIYWAMYVLIWPIIRRTGKPVVINKKITKEDVDKLIELTEDDVTHEVFFGENIKRAYRGILIPPKSRELESNPNSSNSMSLKPNPPVKEFEVVERQYKWLKYTREVPVWSRSEWRHRKSYKTMEAANDALRELRKRSGRYEYSMSRTLFERFLDRIPYPASVRFVIITRYRAQKKTTIQSGRI